MDVSTEDGSGVRRGAARTVLIAALSLAVLALGLAVAGPRALLELATRQERRAAGLERRSVRVGDHTLVYLEGGRGETVLLLHGFGAEKDNWTQFARDLTPRYHVVALDLPGFGESSYVAGASYRIADQARRVHAFADAIGLCRFHLAGNSMGGQIAGQVAVLFPERLLSLMLVDCTGVRPPQMSDMETRLRRGERNPLVVATTDDFDYRMKFLFVQEPAIPGFIKRVLVAQAQARQPQHEAILAQTTPEVEALESQLGSIRARTLILWGDRDRMRDVSSVPVLARGIAGSKSVVMRDCGHVPMSERPQEAAEHYRRFLEAGGPPAGGR